MKFKIGDTIRGLENSYGITNENMYEGKILDVNKERMEVEVIKHRSEYQIGKKYWVDNDDKYFELISNKKITLEELKKLPIGTKITTDRKEDNIFVKIDENCLEFYSLEDDDNLCSCDIEEDLSINDKDYGNKIVKIEVPETYTTIYEYSTEIQEMTIAEIEKELGHPVKIIKEED